MKTIEQQIELGKKLIRKKVELGHGALARWIDENLKCSYPTASRAMKITREKLAGHIKDRALQDLHIAAL